MKRFVLVFFIFSSCIAISNAQRRNSNGEKLVSRVKMFSVNHEDDPYVCYDFGYDDGGNLNYMYRKGCSGYTSIWRKEGNKLKRTEYSTNTLYKPLEFSYTLDESGKIVKFVIKETCLNKKVFSTRYTISYDRVGRVCRIYEENYKTEYGDIERDLNERYETLFEYSDGNCSSRIFEGNRIERTYYSDLYRDMNINIYDLYRNPNPWDFIEMGTEWMNNYSFNMFDCDGCYRFEYHFDDNGNIVRIDVHYAIWDWKVKTIIKIEYAY